MDNSNAEAKEIFYRYGCSHYMIWHEGEMDRYTSYGVSKEQELAWVDEYQREMLDQIARHSIEQKIERCVSAVCSTISAYGDGDVLSTLSGLIERKIGLLDSFSKLLVAEHLIQTVESLVKQKIHVKSMSDANALALKILRDVMDNPITIAPAYSSQEHLAETLKHDKIISRAEKDIRRCAH